MDKQEFKQRLSGTHATTEEYLNRAFYAIGSIIQILESAEIDDVSRLAIYNAVKGMHENIDFQCTLKHHARYMKWCKNK